jgi:hypothetical protein
VDNKQALDQRKTEEITQTDGAFDTRALQTHRKGKGVGSRKVRMLLRFMGHAKV